MWPFKKKKHKDKKTPRYVKICPRCSSIDVEIKGQGGLSGLTALGLPTIYRCRKCGYRGYAFPEIDLNMIEKRKKSEKTKNATKT